MRTASQGRCWFTVITLVMLMSVASVTAQTPTRWVVLGVDLTPDQRSALLAQFGTDEQSANVQTLTADEIRASGQAANAIDPATTANFGASLSCGASGSGIQVKTAQVGDVSTGMYAGALLTAGIDDASLIVAAPADVTVSGPPTLAAVFKIMQAGPCGRSPVDPPRQELAYRWLTTARGLGQALNDPAAATTFILTAQHQLIDGGKGDPAAVEPAFDGASSATSIAIPAEQRPAVLELLQRIAEAHLDWGHYTAGWNLNDAGSNEVQVTAVGQAPSLTVPTTFNGTVRSAAGPGSPLTIEVVGQTSRIELPASGVQVKRNGEPATLADLQPGDKVTLQTGPGGVIQQIDANGGGASGAAGAPIAQATHFVVGTVALEQDRQMSLHTATGQQQLTVPSTAYVARNGKSADLATIKGDDSAVAVLDGDGTVVALFAQAESGAYVIQGTADGAALTEQVLQLSAGTQHIIIPLTAPGLTMTRNGQTTHLGNLHSDDIITVRLDASGTPISVAASDSGPGGSSWWSWLPRWWIPLLIVVVLLAPIPLLLNRRRQRRQPVQPSPLDDPDDLEEQSLPPSSDADSSVP